MDALIELLLGIVFFGIGSAILFVVSLGCVRGEWGKEKLTFPWYCLTKNAAGKWVASGGLCMWIGGLTCAAIAIAVVVFYNG